MTSAAGPARGAVDRLVERYPALAGAAADVLMAYGLLEATFRAGGKLLVCGNGGSAADAEHIVAELMKGFRLLRPVPAPLQEALASEYAEEGAAVGSRLQGALPAVALVAHGALGSAVANDVAADMVFAQQVYGLAGPDDALLALSTSGNSRNVQNAVLVAKVLGLRTVGLTGAAGGRLGEICDVTIRVPAEETADVQELHLPVYHAICTALEARFFG